MKVNLLCGNRNLPDNILEEKQTESWIGIDRGALILYDHDIQQLFAVGDFDSIDEEEQRKLSNQLDLNPLNPEKNDTDLALGIEQAVESGYKEIDVYGATGGRLDHFLGAVQILEKPQYQDLNVVIKLIDNKNEIQYLTKKTNHVFYSNIYHYISFIPVHDKTTISLSNFKYNLEHETLHQGSTLTISNELNEKEGIVEIIEGSVLMIRSKD